MKMIDDIIAGKGVIKIKFDLATLMLNESFKVKAPNVPMNLYMSSQKPEEKFITQTRSRKILSTKDKETVNFKNFYRLIFSVQD